MALNKNEFLEYRVKSGATEPVELPDGSVVTLLKPNAGDVRKWRRNLRDDNFEFLPGREELQDELLLGTLLLNGKTSERMFTDEEILAGALDAIDPAIYTILAERCHEMIGFRKPSGKREKNSSATDSIEPS